ncbi:adenylate kinase [Patescibacteria group bacterium]|nr:adenylate kinase [Patescibacteria group bacterium]MBU1673664.1 adenylate kinase [Patescibacteria group bacterium]MBU1963848.1 adenylate kinase [Patescibacteria group bacterium]
MYKICLFGPQGSGKGTQADLMIKELDIPAVVPGNIFRHNISEKTELGQKVEEYTKAGKLVPDEITIEMIQNRLSEPDCASGFVVDGFPRNVSQAKSLNDRHDITHALLINISDEEAIHRLSRRRVCDCGATYHLDYNAPEKEGICNDCGKELYQRDDDKEDVIKKRLNIYHQETEPIFDIYKEKGVFHEVDGKQAIPKVWEDIKKILGP